MNNVLPDIDSLTKVVLHWFLELSVGVSVTQTDCPGAGTWRF